MLQKRLGNYPCYNRSLADLEYEQWDDIPGFDGYYRVSNLGRIKRMKHERINRRSVVMVYKEMIIAPRIGLAPNHYINDFTYHLFAHFTFDNARYHLPVRRLVYYCFVKPFWLNDKTIRIICKNGIGLDLRSSNLELVSLQESSKRIIQQQRRITEFKNADPYNAALISVQKTSKPISQYNDKGEKLKTYPSGMEASRQTGIRRSSIGSAAKGRERSAGGYFWAFGNMPHFDIESFIEKRHIGFKEKRGTKVTQYDLNGDRIAQYLTLSDAAKAISKGYTNISANIRGITGSAYGYIWKAGWGRAKIRVKKV